MSRERFPRTRKTSPVDGLGERATRLRPPRSSQSGFTLLELLVVMAILGILALFSYPSIHRMIIRTQLESDAREAVTFLRTARLEAIKRSVPVVVTIDTAAAEVAAFADLNDALGDPGIDLIFNPVAGAAEGTTDYVVFPAKRITANASFGGPPADNAAITGFAGVAPNFAIVFNADGSVVASGTLRFGDNRGNFLRVSVQPRTTARVQVFKWNLIDNAWHGRARDTGGTTWEWYS